jgi:hypothetical protein
MVRMMLAVAVAGILAAAARAELEVKDVQVCNGPLGPKRKTLDTYPFDEVFVRSVIVGAKADDKGKVSITKTVELIDPQGKVLVNQKQDVGGVLALGGDTFLDTTSFNLGGGVAPGEYAVKVTLKDNLADKAVTVERKLTCKPAKFALVAAAFFYDAKGQTPAPCGGLVGQALHFRLRAIGFDNTQAEINAIMSVHVLDARGKDVLPAPFTTEVRSNDAEVVKKVTNVTLNGSLALNRPGDFTLRVVFTDRLKKKDATFEAPLHVTAP